MHMLLDMASSPEYLAPSAHHTGDMDDLNLDNIDPAITGMSNASCSSVPPSSVSYTSPDPNSYSEVSHISSFDASPVLDERLLTPVSSSAASPHMQNKHSPFDHHHNHHHSHHQHPHHNHHHHEEHSPQQPTPPHTASMYPYPEYIHASATQAPPSMSMSMPMPSTLTPDATLLPYLHHQHHPSSSSHPHHDDHPAPQSNPYFGSYTVSAPGHEQQQQQHDQYYAAGDLGALGLLRNDSYTHRPLAPMQQHQQQHPSPPIFGGGGPPSHYRLPRLSPGAGGHSRQYSVPRAAARRERAARKNSARALSISHQQQRRESFSPPPPGGEEGSYMQQQQHGEDVMAGMHHHVGMELDDGGPDEEVTLDDKTPADLRRLWDTRRKWIGKKGNGMWEDIMTEYLGEDNLTENKKTQVKAALQMKIHRMLLKHGKWPERDESALLRAYKRWEESRYTELLRLYEEEMAGRKKAYEWKSQHIEAQLVKMGLEEPERDRDSKARKRKQVAARHQARAGGNGALAPSSRLPPVRAHAQQQQHRLPAMYNDLPPYGAQHHYAPVAQHYEQRTPSYDSSAFADQLSAQPPALSDEQNDRLAREILERNPFAEGGMDGDDEDDGDVDVKMELSDYAASSRSRAQSLIPGLMADEGTGSPPDSRNAQRSAAVARQACGELLKQQQFGNGVGV